MTDGTRKVASMVWSREWSHSKVKVPKLAPALASEEATWRRTLLAFVDDLGLADPNWVVDPADGPACGRNRLVFPRFHLSPPVLVQAIALRRAGEEPVADEPWALALWQVGLGELKDLEIALDLVDLEMEAYARFVPEPLDMRTVAQRAAAGQYRTPEQFAVALLHVTSAPMVFEWKHRSDYRRTYEAALQMSAAVLHVYSDRYADLAAVAARAEEVVAQQTRDSVMLLAEAALRSVGDKSIRAVRRLETLVEYLARSPALLDQVCKHRALSC